MRIALLAPSGAGKTAYLTGLYGVSVQDLNEDRSYGVHFSVTDRMLSAHLDRRYTDLLENNDFGEGSKDITAYPISLSTTDPANGQKKQMALEIVDFPGGDLHTASEERKDKIEEIIARLASCDGFIVLLDGEQLVNGAEKQNARILQNRMKANAVKEVLEKALERRRAHVPAGLTDPNAYAFGSGPTPIVFALTKGDVVEDWLAAEEARSGKLENTVRKLFNPTAEGNNAYAGDEGAIANFIRSQFGQVVDAPDIVSARTCVCVYNESEQMFDPRNLENLFQFVLFAGLCNAGAEYQRRASAWRSDFGQKDRHFSSEKNAYESAVAAREKWLKQGFFEDLSDWWNGRSVNHTERVEKWHQDMSSAASTRDSSLISLRQVEENQRTLEVFTQRILSDKMAFLLSGDSPRQSFYQRGLPLAQLAGQQWWRRKCENGRSALSPGQSPQPEPGGP